VVAHAVHVHPEAQAGLPAEIEQGRHDLARGGRRSSSTDDAYWLAARREAGGIIKPLLLRLPPLIRGPLLGPMCRLDLGHLFLSRECAFCEIVFREMAELPDFRQRESFLYALLQHAVQREVIERHLPAGLPVIAEEGFAQRAMTLFGYRPDGAEESRVAAYARAMPKPVAIVWVDTPPDVCAVRLASRTQPPYPLRSLPAAQWAPQLDLARRVLATVSCALQASGIPVVAVQGEPASFAGQVADALDQAE
jgi:hypothetical protein